MPAKGYSKPQGQRPMRCMFLLGDERSLAKRVAKLVKHGTDEAREELRAFAGATNDEAVLRRGVGDEKRTAYTLRAYADEWALIQAVMDAAKRKGNHQPARVLLTKLENAILKK